jgi:hypothetical protein
VRDFTFNSEQALLVAQVLAAFFTAVATLALVYFTSVLARETRRLSAATSQPFVIATLELNQWSTRHIDLRLENTGNAPAFDVRVKTDPQIGQNEPSPKGGIGMNEIDVLRPAQQVSSYVSEASEAMEHSYRVTVQWRRMPNAKDIEEINYNLDMSKYKKMSRLGASSPLHQIAEEVKRSRENWESVVRGQRRLRADIKVEPDRRSLKSEQADGSSDGPKSKGAAEQ